MKKPNLRPTDVHIVVNAKTKKIKFFDANGSMRGMIEAHCIGTGGAYTVYQGDTPPGLYKCGTPDDVLSTDSDKSSYGPWFVPLVEQEGQLSRLGRAGLGVHGGGTGLADPYYASNQGWVATHGCIRVQNFDLNHVASTVKFVQKNGGTAWLSVHW